MSLIENEASNEISNATATQENSFFPINPRTEKEVRKASLIITTIFSIMFQQKNLGYEN